MVKWSETYLWPVVRWTQLTSRLNIEQQTPSPNILILFLIRSQSAGQVNLSRLVNTVPQFSEPNTPSGPNSSSMLVSECDRAYSNKSVAP